MIRKLILTMLLTTGVAIAQSPAATPKSVFKDGVSTSGWIDCTMIEGMGIFFPVKVNGHDAMAYLYGGPSYLDDKMASSLGLSDSSRTASELELGDLTLQDFQAKNADLSWASQVLGKPAPLMLGKEIFQKFAVELDFSHHRIAFRDAARVTKPKGAVELPLVEVDGERVVRLSVNDAPPAQFELELGNVSGPLLVSPAYAREHQLLDSIKTSQRLSGQYIETVFTVNHLSFAGVQMPAAPIAVIPESENTPPSIAGGVGLPLLEHFDMLIDYTHDRIHATPRKDAASAAFLTDRLGLVVTRQKDPGFTVKFVSPGSPAAAAGFKIDEKISAIDQKTSEAFPLMAMVLLRFAEPGTVFAFIMEDGSKRKVTAADFF